MLCMNKEINILQGQSLIDISVQHTGIAENLYAIARANGISIHEELQPGTILLIPKTEVYKQAVQYFIIINVSKPATNGTYTLTQNYVADYNSTISNYQVPNIGKTIQVLNGQSLFDFSIEHLGSAAHVYELAKINNKSVSEFVTAGEIFLLPQVQKNKAVIKYFTVKEQKPATAGNYIQVSQGDYYYDEYDNQEYSI